MSTGMVRWFNSAIGYGFIQDENGTDIFVHYSVICSPGYKRLDDGQVVQFEKAVGPRGEHATLVIPEPRAALAEAA